MREREPRESRLWTHLDQVQTMHVATLHAGPQPCCADFGGWGVRERVHLLDRGTCSFEARTVLAAHSDSGALHVGHLRATRRDSAAARVRVATICEGQLLAVLASDDAGLVDVPSKCGLCCTCLLNTSRCV